MHAHPLGVFLLRVFSLFLVNASVLGLHGQRQGANSQDQGQSEGVHVKQSGTSRYDV